MMAAYRLPSPGSIHGRSLTTLSDIISVYAKEEYRIYRVYFSQISDTDGRRRCFHSSPTNIPSLLSRNSNLLRRNGNADKIYMRQMSSSEVARRKVLKIGRAHRKMQLKQATHKKSAGKSENSKPTKPPEETLAESKADDGHQETISNSPKDNSFGVPIGNPLRERYIRSQQKINYPKTWGGWKEIFRRTKDTYLMTFEGFLLPEKKRDENGNIIPDDEVKAEEDDADGITTMKEKATDAANQISENVQKNISTIQQEAPKLIEMGQQVTGISSREELRAWVSDQLKLGTACLTEFMKGYRSGRDDEVDKMLHEYFKDLDEEKNDTTTITAIDGTSTESENNDTDTKSPKQRRLWGRKERRRAKAMSSKIGAAPLGANE